MEKYNKENNYTKHNKKTPKNLQTRHLLLTLLLLLPSTPKTTETHYKRLLYPEVIERLEKAAIKYPETIKIFDAMEKYEKIMIKNKCQNNELCKHYIVKLTNWKSPLEEIKKRPQIFLIGSMHGNEVVGTNMLTYLTEIFGGNRNRRDIWELLNSRVFVFIPMANPQGYYRVVRVSFFLKVEKDFFLIFFISF